MAKTFDFGTSDPVAGSDFGQDDAPAGRQELPSSVTPSTGRSAADPRRTDAPAPLPQGDPMGTGVPEMLAQPGAEPREAGAGRGIVTPSSINELSDMSRPAYTPSRQRITPRAPRRESVLEDTVLDSPEPTLTDGDMGERVRLSSRAYAETAPAPGAPRTDKLREGAAKPNREMDAGADFVRGPGEFAKRAVGKTAADMGEGAWGAVRAVSDVAASAGVPGASTVARLASESAGAAKDFDTGMGKARPLTDFAPRSVANYLNEQAGGAVSSLAQSALFAGTFGARAVIPMMSIQSAGQQYQAARQAGLDPAMALANAIPYGTFEAIGEKFQGLDKAAKAMGVLMTRGAPKEAIKSAGEVLLKAGIREVPGEIITYLGQTGVDLLPGIGLKQNLTMEEFLDGLRDTVVQAAIMGGAMGGGGAVAAMRGKGAPVERTPEQLAREKGFLVREEQAKRLSAAGEKEVASGIQRQVDTERTADELESLKDQPWAQDATFHERYRTLRTEGKKPAEAAARAAMAAAYEHVGTGLNIEPDDFRRTVDAAAKLPMDKIPAFFEKVTASLVKAGRASPAPEGTVGGAVAGVRDAAVAATLEGVYGEAPPTDTVDAITALEAQQEPAQAPEVAPDTEQPTSTGSRETAEFGAEDLTPNEHGAHQGASSPLNDKTATKAQVLAGVAPLGHMTLGKGAAGGKADVSVENAVGSERIDLHNEPPKWKTPMEHGYHYGYMRRTEGNDGDKFDLFVKEGLPEEWAGTVWVVDQSSRDGKFDEHKGVAGPETEAEARAAYLAHYQKGWKGLRAITPMAWADFKQWVHDGKKTEPANPEAFAAKAARAPDEAAAPGSEGAGADVRADPAGAGAGGGAAAVAPLRLGTTPSNAEAVTVRDGIVHVGKYEAVDFDSGEPVRVAEGASDDDVRQALRKAGAVPGKAKFFGGVKAVAPTAPTEQNAAAPDTPRAAPSTAQAEPSAETTVGTAETPGLAGKQAETAPHAAPPAPPSREYIVDLRKRESVLKSLRACLGAA